MCLLEEGAKLKVFPSSSQPPGLGCTWELEQDPGCDAPHSQLPAKLCFQSWLCLIKWKPWKIHQCLGFSSRQLFPDKSPVGFSPQLASTWQGCGNPAHPFIEPRTQVLTHWGPSTGRVGSTRMEPGCPEPPSLLLSALFSCLYEMHFASLLSPLPKPRQSQ